MVSKLVKMSNYYRMYSVNQWQLGEGAEWKQLNAAQYTDDTSTYCNPQGKNSSSAYRPKNLFFQFNRSIDSNKYELNKLYAVVHIKTSSANDLPVLHVWYGGTTTPTSKDPILTLKAPVRVSEKDSWGGVSAIYDLSQITNLKILEKMVIGFSWKKTNSTSKSEVRIGYVGVNVFLDNKTASKISVSQKLSGTNITLGEKITWTLTAKQNGSNGSANYLVELPPNCKLVSKLVTGGTYSDGVWSVDLTKGKSSVLKLELQPYGVGFYEGRLDTASLPISTLLHAYFGVSEPERIDNYGITYTFYNTIHAKEEGYFDIRICGETNTSLEKHNHVTALLVDDEYDVITSPLYKTAEILPDSYNIDGNLIAPTTGDVPNINFKLQKLGSYCLHLRVPVWSWNSGLVNVDCNDTEGLFEILPYVTTWNISSSKNKNSTSVMSVNIGSPTEWVIRAKAHKHNFMRINDETLTMNIEEPPAYIGCVRLNRGHSADVTAGVNNSLIEERYRNRVYMGKAGDYTEDITMKLRIPPEDVATLEGLVEFDKPVPIDTIPELWDGNPLNHRGWAELYKISNIKKVNDMLYDCEPSVRYLTHEINTEFTCIKDKEVYPSKEGSTIYPPINTYLTTTHAYGDKLSSLFSVDPYDYYDDELTVDDEYVGVYEIPANNNIKFTSQSMQPYGNWDFKFRNTLPSLLSEDYDNNWKMAIRLRDVIDNNILFEHLYHDFQHFDDDGEVVNKCKVTDTYYNGVNYEVVDYSDMYLTKENFAPLVDSSKKPVVVKMNDTINPFDEDNVYPTDVEYSVYRVNPSNYDNYDVVNVVNVPEGVDIYDIPEVDPVDPESYYNVTRYLARVKVTNYDNSTVDFNLLVKNSTQYVANKKVKITITDDLDYTESWVKLTDVYGRVSLDMRFDRGRYTAFVDFDESEEYRGVSAEFFIDVGWEEDTFTDTLFEYENPERFIAYDNTYTVKLIDIDGNSLSGKSINYSFSSLNNTQYSSNTVLVTDSDGKVDIPIKYNNGTQHLKVWFKGDNSYSPCVFAETVTIDIPNNTYTIEADDMEYTIYQTDKTYAGKVTYNDNAVTNHDVIIKIYQDDTLITKTVTTNIKGVFTTTLDIGYGLWYVDMIIESSEDNSTTYITRTIQINVNERIDTKFTYNADNNLSTSGAFPNGLFSVTLSTDGGTLLKSNPVNFEVLNNDDEIIYSCVNKTDDNGVAYLPWYSETEDVIVNFSYDGGMQYNGATGSARVNHAVTSASSTGIWDFIRGKEVTGDSTQKITFVEDTNTIVARITRNGSAVANIETLVVVKLGEEVVSIAHSKTRTVTGINISATVGQPMSSIVTTRAGSIILPPLSDSGSNYEVTIFYKDPTNVVSGGKYVYNVNVNTGKFAHTDFSFSNFTIGDGDGNTVVNASSTISSASGINYDGKIAHINQGSGYINVDGLIKNGKLIVPVLKSKIAECDGWTSNTEMTIDGFGGYNLINICGRVERTKSLINYSVEWTDEGVIHNPTITTNPSQVKEYVIELTHMETLESFSLKITPNDNGVTKPTIVLNKSGDWEVYIKFNNTYEDYSQDIYRTVVTGGEVTSSFYNSLPTEDGRIVIDPENNMGETFGSDVSIELRDGNLSLIDYGMVIDNEALTGGKIFVDNKTLPTKSVKCEVEVSYDNVHSQRINPLTGLLQVNTLENVQTDSSEVLKYQNLICSPSPVPDNLCQFTRHTNEGTLYFYNSKVLDEVNKINGVKYIGCPFNQYKGGTDLKSDHNISLFNLENGMSPVFLDNGLLKVGFHRYSGYVEIHRYDEISNEYYFINAFKIANNPKLKLKENGYSDDKITVLFGDTEWTMWRGRPYVQVKHEKTDLRILHTPDRVTCEVTENSKSMGYIEDIDIYLGKFTPFSSLQEFRKELCIGENIKVDNFSVESLEETTYNISDNEDNTELIETVDGLFTNERALKVVKEESGNTGVIFPSNGSYVAKPADTFSLLIQNIYGDNLPVAVKCRGYTSTSQIPEAGSSTQVGVWESTKEITYETISTKSDETNYRFTCTWNTVPPNVKYIDFILIFEDECEVTLNQIMLYEGESGMNYSKDDSLQKATQTEISFDKTYYANLYNEKDKYGLGVIRPHRTPFTLKYIKASPITVFAPYMKLSKPHDKMDKLLLEYVNSYDQIVSIENIGGYI